MVSPTYFDYALQLTRNLHREKHCELSIELNDVDTFWIVQMNDQRHQAVASFNQKLV
ncbi:hypothetical protein L2E81_21480 [Planktothrix agardhii 1033]|nr:hypothetical protein [Planktothrix agardhii 1033]